MWLILNFHEFSLTQNADPKIAFSINGDKFRLDWNRVSQLHARTHSPFHLTAGYCYCDLMDNYLLFVICLSLWFFFLCSFSSFAAVHSVSCKMNFLEDCVHILHR